MARTQAQTPRTHARRTEIRRIDLGEQGTVVVRFRRLPRGIDNDVASFQPGSLLVQVANPMKREQLPSMVIAPVEGKSGKVVGFEAWAASVVGTRKNPVIASAAVSNLCRSEEDAFTRAARHVWNVKL